MKTKTEKASALKRLIVSLAIVLALLLLICVCALSCYPLYGYRFVDRPSADRRHACVVDGVTVEYQWQETIDADGIIAFFIKGRLYASTEKYDIYRWWPEFGDDNIEYLLFQSKSASERDPNDSFFVPYFMRPGRLEICRAMPVEEYIKTYD